jgi:2-polyprenyl-6-methoxyphenol hydroxylase-like FAD-dependent oxidoreductase
MDGRILVVGAGIGGLAVARTLVRAGFFAEVVEREPAVDEAGMGIYLPGNAARALRALGLEQAVMENAIVIPRQRVSDHDGRLLVEIDLADLWEGVGPCLALPRADLHAVLLDGARDVPIRMGVDVLGLRDRDGTVSVEFGDGTASDYDLVVGADGIRSTVRRLAFGGDTTARPVGQVGWRFVTACPPEITTWSVMLGHRTAFLTIPIGNGNVYCYVVSSSRRPRHRMGIPATSSPATRSPCPSSSTRSPSRASRTGRRSRRWRSNVGRAGGSCWLGTRRMRPRRTWPRAPRWRSRMRWCSPIV